MQTRRRDDGCADTVTPMTIVIFCHSLISDWNHGNAHFLRGVVLELLGRGHRVEVYEPADGWSRSQLVADAGPGAIQQFHDAFPTLRSHAIDLDRLRLDEVLDGADLVLVHEWNTHALVRRIGEHRAAGGRYTLLFHDTHHRSVTDADAMSRYSLEHYDGVLAFGEIIREHYVAMGWSRRAWVWHEAADVRTFSPRPDESVSRDLIWIGNWGDGERSAELMSYLVEPIQALGLSATIFGVRYPEPLVRQLADAGIRYGGWLANYRAPEQYARHLMTVHVPRRPYVAALPGIPTIRVFEALACGIPLVSLPWQDIEGLFTPGDDFLVADTPAAMRHALRTLQHDADARRTLAAHGRATVLARHTCAHRVDELLAIVAGISSHPQPQSLLL
jgi:spore maturation protein CgeB